MSIDQALQIMEQAIMLALKSCATPNDAKAILVAWDTIKPLIKEQDHEDDRC